MATGHFIEQCPKCNGAMEVTTDTNRSDGTTAEERDCTDCKYGYALVVQRVQPQMEQVKQEIK